jgi:hypothetical protein
MKCPDFISETDNTITSLLYGHSKNEFTDFQGFSKVWKRGFRILQKPQTRHKISMHLYT